MNHGHRTDKEASEMNAASWMNGPPRKILLATDLGPRSDRALDRAVSLAKQWQADLIVLHVLENPTPDFSDSATPPPSWKRSTDPVSIVSRQLLADLSGIAEKTRILIEDGDPAETIIRVAEAESCDLIVTGVARDELLGRFLLGSTVDQLLRRSQVPLLVVKERARKPYHHIVVATDFSESSRHAFEAAAHIFPQKQLTLFHAYDPPMASRMTDPDTYRREYRTVVAQNCEAFLQKIQKPGQGWHSPRVLLEYGTPSLLLRDYVHAQEVDLLILGTQGRGVVLEIVIGSVAKEIMERLPCDVLVVREPRMAA